VRVFYSFGAVGTYPPCLGRASVELFFDFNFNFFKNFLI